MTTHKRIRFDPNISTEESTANRSPLDAANTVRATGLLSLATLLLVIQPFMEDLTKANIKLHDQIHSLQLVIDRLEQEETVPRSLRVKFHLEIPKTPDTSDTVLTGLQQQCEASLKEYQTKVKASIVEGRKHEKEGLQKKKEKACLNFICNCARLYHVMDHRYTEECLSPVIFRLINAVETKSIFNTLTPQKCENEMMRWFPDPENY